MAPVVFVSIYPIMTLGDCPLSKKGQINWDRAILSKPFLKVGEAVKIFFGRILLPKNRAETDSVVYPKFQGIEKSQCCKIERKGVNGKVKQVENLLE